MKHIKEYNQFVNEEEGFFKNLLLSAMLALGINSVDAQTIQQDSVKTEIVKDINQFNKSVILNLYGDKQIPYNKLKQDLLRCDINEPDLFIDNYLKYRPDGTLVVMPDFMKGLEIHLNKGTNTYGVGYTFKF
jgi:hypothetical protein